MHQEIDKRRFPSGLHFNGALVLAPQTFKINIIRMPKFLASSKKNYGQSEEGDAMPVILADSNNFLQRTFKPFSVGIWLKFWLSGPKSVLKI